jgi:uncharacterized delta-60 repeat protein
MELVRRLSFNPVSRMLSSERLAPLLLAALLASSAIAQPGDPKVPRTAVFDKTFCIRQINHAASVIALPDGGFAAAGHTNAKGAGSRDAWVIRLDAAGGVLWEKTYGGKLADEASSIAALPDGGFILAGSTQSWDFTKGDAWLIRLDANGEVLWEKTYGNKLAAFTSIAVLAEGGFMAAGKLHEKPVSTWKSVAWVLRLDASGNILWEQSVRGEEARASSIAQLADGSFAAAANVHSRNSDENGVHIIRLGAGGTILSDRTFRDLENGTAQSISALPGGGFAVAGWTYSDAEHKTYAWVLNFGPEDELRWERRLGGAPFKFKFLEKALGSVRGDGAMSVAPAADGGLIVAGRTASKGAGGTDAWLIRLDKDGGILWDKSYGGSQDDSFQSIHVRADGGFIAAGETNSKSPEGSNAWIMRLDATGGTLWEKAFGPKGEVPASLKDYGMYSEAKAVSALPDGGAVAAGSTQEKGAGKRNACVARFDASGTLVWEKTYGGSETSLAHSIVALPDGGFAVAGQRRIERIFSRVDREVVNPSTGEAWIFRLDADGKVLWEKTFGNALSNIATAIASLRDGGFVAGGAIGQRKDGEFGGKAWVVRLSSSGDLIWERAVGESGSMLTFVAALPDGDILAAGTKDERSRRGWLFRFDADGKLLWEKPAVADEKRSGSKLAILPDGSFALAGGLALEKGTSDRKAWVTRFDAGANVLWDKTYAVKGLGVSQIIALPGGGFALAGMTARGRFALYDGWVARLDANGGLAWEETYGGASEDFATDIAVTPDGSLAVGGVTQHAYGPWPPQAWIFTVPVAQQGAGG